MSTSSADIRNQPTRPMSARSASKRDQSTRPTSTPSASKRNRSTRPTSNSTSTNRRSSAYDNNFEQHLIDHGIYLNSRKSRPRDSQELRRRLPHPRPSLSPSRFSENAFEDFQRKHEDLIDEVEVMRDVLPIVYGNTDIPNKQNLLFTKLDPIANDTTVDAKPDFYDGARLEDVDEHVRVDLAPFIVPTGHRLAPVAPNFFLEAKGPKGGADVAKRQACYDGALGARAMHELQSYRQDGPVYDGNAYTITSTYHAGTGTLQMYTTHLTRSTDDTPEYHMSQVNTWGMTGNTGSFRQGATAFRNARDWAREQRDGFILAANERARSTNAGSSFEVSHHDGLPDITRLQRVDGSECSATHEGVEDTNLHKDGATSGSSDCNRRSETTEPYQTEESETSLDEGKSGRMRRSGK
jgi:hypothetical protein